jgi:peptide/nickel transport system substrate-binding protein
MNWLRFRNAFRALTTDWVLAKPSCLLPRVARLARLIVAVAALAVIAVHPVSAAEPKEGGTVVMATRAQVQGFDPFTIRAANRESTMAGALVFSSFFTLDRDRKPVPDLATSLDGSADGLTWRLKLRSGLTFSNGAPYTARDVVNHFKQLLDPAKNQAFAAVLGPLREAVSIDDTTVEFRLSEPWAPFPRTFFSDFYLYWVMPAGHEVEAGQDLNRRPIGAGPYMMTEWKQDDSITFVKNPHYWNPQSQHLDKIVIRFLPDPTARFTAVKTGDIDIFYEPLGKQVNEARADNTLKVEEYNGTGAYTLNLNTSVPPLDDVRVRQALAYALDRKVELKVAFDGIGQLATSFWGPGSEWNCPDVGYPEYNPDKAKALLKEYGKPVKVTLQSQPTPTLTIPTQLYQSFWQKVGIETEIRNIQGGPSYINPVQRGDYQIAWWEVADTTDPDFQVFLSFHSKSGGNLTRINDPNIDAAIERGRRSLDPEVRKQAYCDFSREMAKQMPVMMRIQAIYFAITQPRVHDIPPIRRGVVRLNAAWVDPK